MKTSDRSCRAASVRCYMKIPAWAKRILPGYAVAVSVLLAYEGGKELRE